MEEGEDEVEDIEEITMEVKEAVATRVATRAEEQEDQHEEVAEAHAEEAHREVRAEARVVVHEEDRTTAMSTGGTNKSTMWRKKVSVTTPTYQLCLCIHCPYISGGTRTTSPT